MEIHQKPTQNGDALQYDYDVFLSFRGPDTRAGFTDFLYNHLTQAAGLRVFRDDDELNLGDKIERILLEIDNSRLCIPVFSKTFAQSKWCLWEVTRMVEMQKDVLPIFYDVTVDDVKLETPLYNQFMPQHVEKSGEKEVGKWKEALRTIAAREGKQVSTLSLDDTAFFEGFVKELLVKLKYRRTFEMDAPISLESQLRNVMQLLDIDSRAVRYLGIHGMGGIGKTTLVKDIFNKIKDKFDCSCFLEDIRESLRRHGSAFLMKKLLKSLNILASGGETDEELSRLMEERFRRKKILIVLDDVDQWQQIGKLAGKSSWFGPGSRIIVTSRNKSVMERVDGIPSEEEVLYFEMKPLGHDDALRLFNRHAFKEGIPSAGFRQLSEKVVSLMGGLPLALKIIGSSLYNRKREVWEEFIRKLKDIPEAEVKERLRISYDALSDEQKQIYLDSACFFVGRSVTYPIYMWRACQFFPKSGLEILCSMSLLQVLNDGTISMHDLLRDLGRDIVREENIKLPAHRSRLWEDEKAIKVLKTTRNNFKVKALHVEGDLAIDLTQQTKVGTLEKLRYLDLQRTNLKGDFQDIFPELIWLSFHCHINLQATTFAMTKLVILDFSYTNIDESWLGWSQLKTAKNLKVLDLSKAQHLTRTPYFWENMSLERLILYDCIELDTVDGSIGELNGLVVLDLQFTKINNLPDSVQGLVELKELRLGGCHKLKKLPPTLGALKSLVTLDLSQTALVELPSSIGELASLKYLSLSYCSHMEKLPDSLGNLTSLVELQLETTRIIELPESIGGLENLEKLFLSNCSNIKALPVTIGDLKRLALLDLSRTGIIELPESLGGLENLRLINLQHCPLKTLPESIGALKKLEKLDAQFAHITGSLPSEISGLSSLEFLNLSHTRVCELPSSISQLHRLRSLILDECNQLQELPDLPTNLVELFVSSQSLHAVRPLSNLQSLERLSLTTSPLASSDSIFGICKLTQLVELRLHLRANTTLPDEFGSLIGLKGLVFGWPSLTSALRLPHSLENMYLHCVEQELDFPNLPDLKNLTFLEVKVVMGMGRILLSLPESLTDLHVRYCSDQESWSDISHLKNLRNLHVLDCQSLTEIPGLGKLKNLENLAIERCHSLTKLENLSELKQIECVRIDSCRKLGYPEGVDSSKVTILGEDFQEISGAITNARHDICSLLSSPGRDDFLIRGNDHQVKVDYLKGKKVLLYLHGSWVTFAFLVMTVYLNLHEQGKHCVVVRVPDDSVDEEIFKKLFSSDWLAVPFSDWDRRRRLLKRYKISEPTVFQDHPNEAPQIIIFDESGQVLTTQGFDLIGSYGPHAYPFTLEDVQFWKSKDEELRRNQSITLIFKEPFSTKYVLTLDGNKVQVSELEGKVVGIYFSCSSSYKCTNMTRMLHEVQRELKAHGENFEIVWAPIEKSIDLYLQAFKSPRSTVVSWLVICFRLYFYFRVSALPTLVMIGQDGKTLQMNAAELISRYGAKAYPFTPEKINKARNEEECKILVSACREMVITNTGESVDASALAGKNILLYFSCKCHHCWTFLPKLMEAYSEIKAKHEAFEVIYMSCDKDEASFSECFSTMPWLAFPFGDEMIGILDSKLEVTVVPTLVAIGPTDEIITKDARHFIIAYGSDAYPFTNEHISNMVNSWPHRLHHAELHPHELALTAERRDYTCYACYHRQRMPLWSYSCIRCHFDLHPKCAFQRSTRELPEEHGTRLGSMGYPFPLKKIAKEMMEERERLVFSVCREFVITNTGERVDASTLAGKNILLFFLCKCYRCCILLPMLMEAYNEIKAKHDAFEVIYMSCDEDEASFRGCFSTMPWLGLPFRDERIDALRTVLEVTQIPALVAVGPTYKIIRKDVINLLVAYGSNAYPFTNEHISNMLKSWPHKLQHPLHVAHDLTLTDERQQYVCSACNYRLRTPLWSYSCISCKLDLHPKCAFEGSKWESPEELRTRLESMAYPFTSEKIDKAREEERGRVKEECEGLVVSFSREFIARNATEGDHASALARKSILLYFSSQTSDCCAFMPKLVEAYNEMKARGDAFEVITICHDQDEASFRRWCSTMPWLSLPFGDVRIRILYFMLDVTQLPTVLAIGPTDRIIRKDIKDLILAYGSDAYPFTYEHINNIMIKSWPHKLQHPIHAQHELALTDERRYICDACDNQLGIPLWSYYCKECDFDLHPKCAFEVGRQESPEDFGTRDNKIEKPLMEECIRFVFSDCKDSVITNKGECVDSSILVGKNILLYFTACWSSCPCAFLPNLLEAYSEMKPRDGAFEVIFMSNEKDEDEASFREFFSTMPWLALPFGDVRIQALAGLLEITRIPAVVAIGPTDRVIAKDVADFILAYGLDAYPFTNEHITNMVKSWPCKLQHPLHPHELALTERQLYSCDACHHELPAHAWSYHCKKCDFDIHPKCAFKEGSLESPEEHGTRILLRGECSESSSTVDF